MEAGEVGWEDSRETAVHRGGLQAEVHEAGRGPGFANGRVLKPVSSAEAATAARWAASTGPWSLTASSAPTQAPRSSRSAGAYVVTRST